MKTDPVYMCTSHRVRSTSESCGARASTVCLSCFAVSLGHLLHVPTLLGIARCYLANHVLKMRALLGVSYCYLPDHMLHVRVLLVMLSFSISRVTLGSLGGSNQFSSLLKASILMGHYCNSICRPKPVNPSYN